MRFKNKTEKKEFEQNIKKVEFHFTVKGESVDEKNYTAEFIMSTDHVDRHGDIVDQESWELENFMKNPVMLLQHDSNQFPIGKWENIGVETIGSVKQLVGTARFAYKEYEQARIAFDLVKGGFMNTVSVGFRSGNMDWDEKNEAYRFSDNELLETSLVSIPANANALIKQLDTSSDDSLKEQIKDVKEEIEESIEQDKSIGLKVNRKTEAVHLLNKAMRKFK